jgi:hypothetical protein
VAEDDVRVLIVGLPRLLRELFEQAFGERPGYTLVPAHDGLERLAEAVEAERPDYVVVPLEGAELPRECTELLDERARVKVIGVEEVKGHARLVRLRPSARELDDVPPHELVERLEEVATEAAG